MRTASAAFYPRGGGRPHPATIQSLGAVLR